jgi:N-acetylglutamate synthase-like GNAT family acetyltransferase
MPASIKEGFDPMQWLQEDWEKGKNRFDAEGEAFYVVRSDGRLIGLCGLNRDPYALKDGVCKLRRLYIFPAVRRRGVGRSLVKRAIDDARGYFNVVHLRTLDSRSAAFFESIGFTAVDDQDASTHLMILGDSVVGPNI